MTDLSPGPHATPVRTRRAPISVLLTTPQDTLPRVLARLAAGEKPPVEAWDREQKAILARGILITTDNQIDVATVVLHDVDHRALGGSWDPSVP